jgi:hypothetical protein
VPKLPTLSPSKVYADNAKFYTDEGPLKSMSPRSIDDKIEKCPVTSLGTPKMLDWVCSSNKKKQKLSDFESNLLQEIHMSNL